MWYNLDPSHYYTTPGFAWDASLKFSKTSFRTIKQQKWSISLSKKEQLEVEYQQCEVKWAIQQRKKMKVYFITMLLIYMVMQWHFRLPVSNFTIINSPLQDQINNCIYNWNFDNELGYILEVDINIPVELHDYFNELPHYLNIITID